MCLPIFLTSILEMAQNAGADGIFVYQADGHCADPFNRLVLDWDPAASLTVLEFAL